ncbi:Glutelin type-A 2 [Melia azedarach]|uniref:Glutelin type-A 2 n=1 Tax=Melia azedarach TaxID=155640 RepID=A0ACC1Y1T5_MELAZ|nr:Glutelin type-A 2 [Melia azedarach]
MDMDFTPKFAKQLFEGEGGSYHSWSATEFPLLAEAKIGAGFLVLRPGGFALPHYADSSKIGYVLQGEQGSVGLVLPNSKTNSNQEIVLCLQTGDVIPVPLGSVSWWYNHGNSDVIIVFLGETSNAYVPGEFTYFFLTGALGMLGGFSTEFIGKAFNYSCKKPDCLAKSQTGALLVKLAPEEGQNMPVPQINNANKWVKNIVNFPADIQVERAGIATSLTGTNFPFLEEAGLSCSLVKLEPNAVHSPQYTTVNMVQVFYVVKGSGKVQIVGLNSKLVLDTNVVAGQLLVVPRFFVAAIVADGEGIECFSIKTSTGSAIGELTSKESVFNVISPSVLQFSLNVKTEFVKFFKEKIGKSEILIPPKN